jgi:multisubunit Na+/H+ antiporter MnhF subunit
MDFFWRKRLTKFLFLSTIKFLIVCFAVPRRVCLLETLYTNINLIIIIHKFKLKTYVYADSVSFIMIFFLPKNAIGKICKKNFCSKTFFQAFSFFMQRKNYNNNIKNFYYHPGIQGCKAREMNTITRKGLAPTPAHVCFVAFLWMSDNQP